MLASIRARRTEIWRWAAADQDCSGGTFEIVSVDDNTVEGRLCHVNNFFSSAVPSLAGSFIAPPLQVSARPLNEPRGRA